MAFVTTSDLDDHIKANDLNVVVADDPTTTDSVISSVEAEVKDMFSGRYNMVSELAKTGAARNGVLLYNMVIIIIYRLLLRTNRGAIDEAYFQEYERANKKLLMIARGQLDSTLTLASADDPISAQVQTGCSDDADFNY